MRSFADECLRDGDALPLGKLAAWLYRARTAARSTRTLSMLLSEWRLLAGVRS